MRLGEVEVVGADLSWRAIAVALEDPGPVADVLEGVKGLAQLLDAVKWRTQSRFSLRSG